MGTPLPYPPWSPVRRQGTGRGAQNTCGRLYYYYVGTDDAVANWTNANTARDDQSVTEALLAGATGYVPKFVGSEELIRSIREVAAGEYRIPAPAIEKVVTSWVRFVEDQKVVEMEVLTD